jgi:hypothetical protein
MKRSYVDSVNRQWSSAPQAAYDEARAAWRANGQHPLDTALREARKIARAEFRRQQAEATPTIELPPHITRMP